MEIKNLTKRLLKFRDDRDWKQFHNPKDMAISLALEAAEVLEHFQWKNPKEIEEYIKTNKADISYELADVLIYILLICYDLEIDIIEAVNKKMELNERRYPVEKIKGKHTKYNKL